MRQWMVCAAMAGALMTTETASAQEPRGAGFGELLVIDPGVEEQGKPTVIIDGGRVEIPPTLHIHPNYYSGDREYQAQLLEGGPTIIVANHPLSGKQLYIDAILPAGAPIIAYSAHSITYVFPDRRVCIEFCKLDVCRATVKYVSGRGVVREAREQFSETVEAVREEKKKSRLAAELGELRTEVTDIARGSLGVASTAGAIAVERTRALTRILPGAAMLRSAGQQSERRAALEKSRQEAIETAEQLQKDSETLPTVR